MDDTPRPIAFFPGDPRAAAGGNEASTKNREGTMEQENTSVKATPEAKRRKAAPRKRASGTGTRKTAVRRKPAARRKAAGWTMSFESVINTITGGVAVARAAIAEASGQSATVVVRALGSASASSRKTITRLAREWKGMDPRKKARILAALLGAAAAASAPLVRRRFKK